MRRVVAAVGLASVLGWAGYCSGTTYQPLDVGSVWQYTDDLDDIRTDTVVGHRAILGVETVVLQSVFVAPDEAPQVSETFWTTNGEGDLFLHGGVNYAHQSETAYSPPVLVLDAPLESGKSWVTQGIQPYDLDGNPLGWGPFDYGYMVYSVGNVTVPAGTFYAYGVGFYLGRALPCGRDELAHDVLVGLARSGTDSVFREATDWYAEEVGLVQRASQMSPERTMRLTAWQPSPVRDVGWGRIKALFR